jgi:hypothetical protein
MTWPALHSMQSQKLFLFEIWLSTISHCIIFSLTRESINPIVYCTYEWGGVKRNIKELKGGNEIKIGERAKSSGSWQFFKRLMAAATLRGQSNSWSLSLSLPSTISFTPPLFVLLCLHRGPLDTTNAPSTQCLGGGGDLFVPLFSGFSIGHQKDDDVRFPIFLCSAPRHTEQLVQPTFILFLYPKCVLVGSQSATTEMPPAAHLPLLFSTAADSREQSLLL